MNPSFFGEEVPEDEHLTHADQDDERCLSRGPPQHPAIQIAGH